MKDIEELVAATMQTYTRLIEPFKDNSLEAQSNFPGKCISHICDTFVTMVLH